MKKNDVIIKKIISNPKLLEFIANGTNILGIVYGGSRMLDINTEGSDYDLNIIISNEDSDKLNEKYKYSNVPCGYLCVNGKDYVHWYYMSEKCMVGFADYHKMFWQIEAFYGWENPENYILVNDKETVEKVHQSIIKKFKKNIEIFKDEYYEVIEDILKNKTFHHRIHKDIYHIYVIGHLLNNIPINMNFITEFKSLLNEKFNKSIFEEIQVSRELDSSCVYILQKLKEYLDKI